MKGILIKNKDSAKVIFLDRDGVINEYPGDYEYVKSPDEFRFLPRVKPALKKLQANGFKIFIVSNQAGVSKGIYSKKALDLITAKMLKGLSSYRVNISGVYYCTHRQEDNCSCRKPKTGLVDLAISQLRKEGYKVQLRNSYFVGDTIRDTETGKRAGIRTILVFSGKEKAGNKATWQAQPDFTASSLSKAVDIILNNK